MKRKGTINIASILENGSENGNTVNHENVEQLVEGVAVSIGQNLDRPTNVEQVAEGVAAPAQDLNDRPSALNDATITPQIQVELFDRILSYIPSEIETRLVARHFNIARNNSISEAKRDALNMEIEHFNKNKAEVLKKTRNALGEENETVKKDFQRLEFLNTASPDYYLLDQALQKLNCSIILARINMKESRFTFGPGYGSIGYTPSRPFEDIKLNCNNCFLTRFPNTLLEDKKLATCWQSFTSLDLSNNQLSSLPKKLWQLTNLKGINISRNKIKTLPVEIGQLANLRYLVASCNELSSLPEEIAQLTKLEILEINTNKLNSLPVGIRGLISLGNLDISGNRLSSLPSDLKLLTQLMILNVSNNKLSIKPQVSPKCIVTADNNPFENNSIKKKP